VTATNSSPISCPPAVPVMLKKLFQLWSIEGPWKNQSVPSTDIDITGAPPAIQHWTVISPFYSG
jgi:hypothetical protein